MRAYIVGLDHWLQRYQDDNAERNLARRALESSIRRLIKEFPLDIVFEEAGDDQQVAADHP